MRVHAESLIPKDERYLFRLIERCVDNLTPLDAPSPFTTCHEVATAVAEEFGLELREGYYLGPYEHSWTTTKSSHVIDVYPVGCIGGPILIDKLVAERAYREGVTIPYVVKRSVVDSLRQRLHEERYRI